MFNHLRYVTLNICIDYDIVTILYSYHNSGTKNIHWQKIAEFSSICLFIGMVLTAQNQRKREGGMRI